MILALDLSTPRGSLAVVDCRGEIRFSEDFRAHRSHNALVFTPLKKALEVCATSGPSCVVVGTGPGSYTGVRVAIAAGTGIALGFGIPLIGWPSANAARPDDVGGAPFLFTGDARRGNTYAAEVDPGSENPEFAFVLTSPECIADWVAARPTIPAWTFDPEPPPGATDSKPTYPEATCLGQIVAKLSGSTIDELAQNPVQPIYLAAPFITRPKSP